MDKCFDCNDLEKQGLNSGHLRDSVGSTTHPRWARVCGPVTPATVWPSGCCCQASCDRRHGWQSIGEFRAHCSDQKGPPVMNQNTAFLQERSWADGTARPPRRDRKVGNLPSAFGGPSRGARLVVEKSNQVFGKWGLGGGGRAGQSGQSTGRCAAWTRPRNTGSRDYAPVDTSPAGQYDWRFGGFPVDSRLF